MNYCVFFIHTYCKKLSLFFVVVRRLLVLSIFIRIDLEVGQKKTLLAAILFNLEKKANPCPFLYEMNF